MKEDTANFLKIVGTFTISPGFSGIIFFLLGSLAGNENNIRSFWILFEYVYLSIIFGFFGGMTFYSTPAFILGIIYASLGLKKNLISYIFIIFFSPIFLITFDYILDYMFTTEREIPFSLKVEKTSLFYIACPLSSLSSIIAAWISFPKDEKIASRK